MQIQRQDFRDKYNELVLNGIDKESASIKAWGYVYHMERLYVQKELRRKLYSGELLLPRGLIKICPICTQATSRIITHHWYDTKLSINVQYACYPCNSSLKDASPIGYHVDNPQVHSSYHILAPFSIQQGYIYKIERIRTEDTKSKILVYELWLKDYSKRHETFDLVPEIK